MPRAYAKNRIIIARRSVRAEEFYRQLKSGLKYREIAEKAGVSPQYVHWLLKHHKPLTDDEFSLLKIKAKSPILRRSTGGRIIFVYFVRPKDRRRAPIKIGSAVSPESRLEQMSATSPYP